jgi:hypothetical protein
MKAVYLPGEENIEADRLSRLYDSTDCHLNPSVFKSICEKFEIYPSLDAFASRANRLVERFFSLHRDKVSLGTNSLYHSCVGEACVYAFPPIPLIGKVVRKAIQEEVPLILITPDWESLPSYPILMQRSRTSLLLPSTQECVQRGEGMKAAGADLAPGRLRAWLL